MYKKLAKEALVKSLKNRVISHLQMNGYHLEATSFSLSPDITKRKIRRIHKPQREDKLQREIKFINTKIHFLKEFLADGEDINPSKIEPDLIEVLPNTLENEIFRLATLNWSVPVSNGFGRRIRFLVVDRQNNKLIGLIALGDPVFNLRARETWIGWNLDQKLERLANTMDAYILGAVPPYSNLIGGKLIASLVASDKVQRVFKKKYGDHKSLMEKRKIYPKLALITTTSALGKSSVYDRLKIEKRISPEKVESRLLFNKIGETRGFGHFHIPQNIFEDMRQLLRLHKHKYADGFGYGKGPNWKFRVIRQALKTIGLNEEYLSHGIKREVYAVPLAENTLEFLRGEHKRLRLHKYSIGELADFCKNRWIVPRSQRDDSYKKIDSIRTIQNMLSI